MNFKLHCALILTALIALNSVAKERGQGNRQEGTARDLQRASDWNRTHPVSIRPSWKPLRPFSEIEGTGYVAISAQDQFELPELRRAIAKNLPLEVSLIVYVTEPSEVEEIQATLGSYLGDRLKFLMVPNAKNIIWARDALPFPVYVASEAGLEIPAFGLVDSIYGQGFEPDLAVARALSLASTRSEMYFRGGNLLSDLEGNCFAERAREVAAMNDPETFFRKFFGCISVTLLEQQGGIGDIDERIKFMKGKEVFTDNESYAAILEARGYQVHLFPTTGSNYETYMNALFVNGTMFVPQMGIDADVSAIKAYEKTGLKTVGVYTRSLADLGHGNIHCVTMNYPIGSFTPSKRDSRFLEFRRNPIR